MNIQEINLDALSDAVTSLVGDNGARIIRELYNLLERAEARGYAAGQFEAQEDAEYAAFAKAWEDENGYPYVPGEYPYVPGENDMFYDIRNEQMCGADGRPVDEEPTMDFSRACEVVTDADAYAALDRLHGYHTGN